METIERKEVVRIDKANLRVIHFIREDDRVDKSGQMRTVLDIIKTGHPIFRHQLVVAAAPHITSTKTVSQVMSYCLQHLKIFGCIKVQSFDEFQQELEKQATK